jgi:hypothetical protein
VKRSAETLIHVPKVPYYMIIRKLQVPIFDPPFTFALSQRSQ